MIMCLFVQLLFFFFKQKTAYEMRISDWSSDVCSSDLTRILRVSASSVTAAAGDEDWQKASICPLPSARPASPKVIICGSMESSKPSAVRMFEKLNTVPEPGGPSATFLPSISSSVSMPLPPRVTTSDGLSQALATPHTQVAL